MQKSKYWVSFVALVISLMSCDSKRVFDEYQTVSGAWSKDNAIEFKLMPPDTTKAYNLFINLRNTEAYKLSNLYVIVELSQRIVSHIISSGYFLLKTFLRHFRLFSVILGYLCYNQFSCCLRIHSNVQNQVVT